MKNLPEVALIKLCRENNRAAWDSLICRHRSDIYRFAYSLCHNDDDAGDIAGQVYVRLYQSLHTFREDTNFRAWLFCIIRSAFIDLCIRTGHRQNLSLDSPFTDDSKYSLGDCLVDPANTPEEICIENESTRFSLRTIRQLPTVQRQILRLYHTEGKSYQEIAEQIGISIGTVKSRLNRARQMLRDRLAPAAGKQAIP